jgi:hypothetical protein
MECRKVKCDPLPNWMLFLVVVDDLVNLFAAVGWQEECEVNWN